MKNVVLICQDRSDYTLEERFRLVKSIAEDGGYRIVLLVVHPTMKKEDFLAIENVERVIDSLELEYMESMEGIDFDTITSCRDLQMNIESAYYRLYSDYQLDKYTYYAALSFWNQFFKTHHVDILIGTKPFHGYAYDCCDLIARKYHVKFFHVDWVGYHKSFGFYTAKSANRFYLLPVKSHSCPDVAYLLDSEYDKTKNPPTAISKSCFRKLMYRVGGNLLEDFAVRLLHNNWKPQNLDRKRRKIYWSDKLYGYWRQKRAQKCLHTLFQNPKGNEKYICYLLHVEPEATILNTTVIESQLVVIKMLSENLPDGWFIYVKEHPAQFDINNDTGYYHMWDGQFFKTKMFYRKLASIPHVKIVPTETPSDELVDHAQAVASITGTVLLESVLKKKPVLVFSELTPVTFMQDSFFIQSFDDCKRAMEKIAAGFRPEYRDADAMVQRYTFQGEYVADNIVALLHQECPAD
ncbi:MAG: capsular biosynthesis protein [Selenomonas sp.]|uniref:capsular polysaccharide export protein, LipB/KpsS family n=1 Tax=Selenomonas sp. TaxID=2053611 RepID=UPI0025CE3718|nr:hypothetical protein [Selenomonas sp.]MCI6086952.1 capsular biosynthesis protein [Selenomonas sp.]